MSKIKGIVKLRGRNSGAEKGDGRQKGAGLMAWRMGRLRSERGLLRD